MKYFSTFSGIGGFELGIIKAYESLDVSNSTRGEQGRLDTQGSRPMSNDKPVATQQPHCIGFSEIDKYASAIYQSHFPDHKNYGDITKINAAQLPDFDLLVGGFPCQAFSIAGRRMGFEDTRGTLFFDLARILKAKQPRLFVFENVKGLLSHDNGRTFSTIISTIAELGYDCQWQVLNSKNHGVPQNRERVFIVGHLRGTSRPEVFPFIGAGGEADPERVTSNAIDANYWKGIDNHGVRTGIYQLNNPKHSNDRVYRSDGISPTLNTMQGGMRQPFVQVREATKQGYAEAHIGDSINYGMPNSKTRRGRVGGGVAQTLDTGMQQGTLTPDMRIRRLTPTECERLQGFPDGWTGSLSDTQRYKTLGNAVTVNVVQDIMSKILLCNL